jgi:hypothetical protein
MHGGLCDNPLKGMRSFSTKVPPVLRGRVLFRLWLYSVMLLTLLELACLFLYETLAGEMRTPGVWIPLLLAFGVHVFLALAIFWKEMRVQPAPSLHWLDGIALVIVWWIGPLAWTKERQRHRQITSRS